MKLSRYLTEDLIKLEMETVIEPPAEGASLAKWREDSKRMIINELVSLLENGARIGNRTKLVTDFVNREKKATTGIGHGVAIPHIRSLQAKDLMLAFARSTAGYDFDSLDQKLTHLFFVMAAPPYDDALYLKVFKSLSQMLQRESFREELMHVTSPGEVIRAIKAME
ncbi:MAG: PTS sugar transporter subunit IIA [Candidatus Zixiibacteriota bacterium]